MADKAAFVRESAGGYGLGARDGALAVDAMRADEFPQLRDCTYVDHAGATLYARSQLDAAFEELRAGVFGNPHSHQGPAAAEQSTAGKLARVRRQALRFFGAREDEYALVFTSGATAALKLVGECFPWTPGSAFAHAVDSHTSVLGIRAYAARGGAEVRCVGLDELERLGGDQGGDADTAAEGGAGDAGGDGDAGDAPVSLFAFPGECNFSGVLHPLSIIERVRRGGCEASARPARPRKWLVLLDAAKLAATHPLDLSVHRPDFVALSFYKLLGYPTGLGALLVRRTALPLLRKTYFGGGAVKSILASSPLVVPRDAADALGAADGSSPLADGTQPFLSILSLRHGLARLERLGMANVEAHTAALARLLAARLAERTHWNGRRICELYGDPSGGRGSIVACNFLRADGSYVGYAEVHKLAEVHAIHLRTGCFCNPGACQQYLRLTDADLLANMAAGHVCGDDMDIVDGRPTGAVRLSLGYMSTFEDVAAVLAFVDTYFVSRAPPAEAAAVAAPATDRGVVLRKITLFPIKSCAGMSVDAWPVGARGLLFDREWAVVDAASGAALSLKDTPQLCLLHPRVDLQQQTLSIAFGEGGGDVRDGFSMPLRGDGAAEKHGAAAGGPRDIRVCAGACKANDAGTAASEWISARLGRPCALVRVSSSHLRASTAAQPKARGAGGRRRASGPDPADSDADSSDRAPSPTRAAIGFANQAQFLLVSRQSVARLNEVLAAVGGGGGGGGGGDLGRRAMQVDEDAFRANLVVDGCTEPFAEDRWRRLRIGDAQLDVSGPCGRCSAVNVDQRTGAFDRRPLQALSRFRRVRSSIFFGQYLTRRADERAGGGVVWLRALDPVDVEAAE